MITPLMHILTCLDSEYKIKNPANILYLNKQDRNLIIDEARRLGNLVCDKTVFSTMVSDTGLKMICPTQRVAGVVKDISPYTGLLLTKVRECMPVYLREVNSISVEESEDDLSADAVVLRIEGNSRYVYHYVYNIMRTPQWTYLAKIAKLKELYLTIINHLQNETKLDAGSIENNAQRQELMSKLTMFSQLSYWQGLLYTEYIKYYGAAPKRIDAKVLDQVKRELWDLGIYGFCNPLQMFLDFNNARITRKIEVDIEDWVLLYLQKVILSGGVSLE